MSSFESRRRFLRLACAAGAATFAQGPLLRALADGGVGSAKSDDEFFIFIHAAGGWDVTLWADPRNEKRGLVDPATNETVDIAPLTHWKEGPPDGDAHSFEIVQPRGSKIAFGPGIGDLVDHYDRMTVINGLAMNTVSHPDGTAFSATGRHLVGGRSPASSVDTMMANELGREQTFPAVSVNFPSSYVGDGLDRRVVPLRIGSVGVITRALDRSSAYETEGDREAVTAMLSKEAHDLAQKSAYPDVLEGFDVQYEVMHKMLGSKLQEAFSPKGLQAAHPELDYKAKYGGGAALNAAFTIEAMKRNVVRCVGFAMGGFDTHNVNYKTQPHVQQELFGVIARLLQSLDVTPHPTLGGKKLADHTHILVVSDFCRTPQINVAGGRDHYPNNSALVLSPRFASNMVFGRSDHDQLLPMPVGDGKTFAGGPRPISPPDLLATFVHAFGVEPRKYMRDGEVVRELLKT